ncbi:MAG: hypothetical protein ACI8PT_004742 [Gammaproteobacteria bacterium]|jgi:hypothetical protein
MGTPSGQDGGGHNVCSRTARARCGAVDRGVGVVTTVVLPASKRIKIPEQRVALFESIEGRFAWQARVTTLAVGICGFYITTAWDL